MATHDTTTTLTPFHFQFNAHEVRIQLDTDGTPWWVAKDVCAILNIHNISDAVGRLETNEKRVGETDNQLIINESGLYRLIFRSNKDEAKVFQRWVFSEVLPQIRKAGKYEIPQPSIPATYHEKLAMLDAYEVFIERLGLMDDRDRLMLKDMARTILPEHLGYSTTDQQQKLLPERTGFFLADRIRALGYTLTRTQETTLMASGLAKEVAKEYRDLHKTKPMQTARFVDGAVRQVNWYHQEDMPWIDPLIQKWCARLNMTL